MKKLVFLLVCSQIMKICVASQINTKVAEGVNFYKISYSLVDRKLKNSENVEEPEKIEQGILLEEIKKIVSDSDNKVPMYECHIDYLPIEVTQNLYRLGYRYGFSLITDLFKILSFSGEASFIVFHLNNFRYGLSFNSSWNSKMFDFNLGTSWNARLLDNEWVYEMDGLSRKGYDENFWVEYKVVNVHNIDSKIKRFTIEWKGLRSYLGSLYQWDRYSKRHGRLVIDNDGTLREFTINSPKLMKMFNYYDFTDDKEIENCLKIIKIGPEEFNHLKPKKKL